MNVTMRSASLRVHILVRPGADISIAACHPSPRPRVSVDRSRCRLVGAPESSAVSKGGMRKGGALCAALGAGRAAPVRGALCMARRRIREDLRPPVSVSVSAPEPRTRPQRRREVTHACSWLARVAETVPPARRRLAESYRLVRRCRLVRPAVLAEPCGFKDGVSEKSPVGTTMWLANRARWTRCRLATRCRLEKRRGLARQRWLAECFCFAFSASR